MPLTPEQMARVTHVLDQKLKGSCPLCNERQWTFGTDLVLLETSPEAGSFGPLLFGRRQRHTLLGGVPSSLQSPTVFPMLPIMCRNCGNMMLMNVYTLGIADLWPNLGRPVEG